MPPWSMGQRAPRTSTVTSGVVRVRGARTHNLRDVDAELVEEAPRVRRHRLEIAPLRLGIQRAERKR